MKVGISVKLDVTKIDKSRLFKGEKGTYLNLTTFVELDEKDQYDNNGFVTQEQTKEEREAKTQLPIIGNVSVFWKGESNEQRKRGYDEGIVGANKALNEKPEGFADLEDTDIPF